jgi:hypothetical protein
LIKLPSFSASEKDITRRSDMADELVLMEKGPATMNVPPDKVQAYLNNGWTITGRSPEPQPLKAVDIIEPTPEGKPAGRRTSKK